MSLLEKDNYLAIRNGDDYVIQGGVIDKSKPIINEAHFRDIEAR